MKKKHILLLLVVLLLALAIPASGTQYNPPWAHNYGFLYSSPPWAESLDTRSHATYAANVQSIVGYDSYNLPDSGAYVAFNNMKDDAVFYFIGHGGGDPDSPGGTLIFFNGTISYILAEYRGFFSPNADQYFLSSSSTELNDILLAVYVACYSGKDSVYVGNLVDTSYQKGVDNTIGFTDTLLYPHCGYWSDRFWYRCLYGSGGSPQTFNYAASGAVGDVLMEKYSFGGVNKMYSMYSYPYNYLNPVRYGIV